MPCQMSYTRAILFDPAFSRRRGTLHRPSRDEQPWGKTPSALERRRSGMNRNSAVRDFQRIVRGSKMATTASSVAPLYVLLNHDPRCITFHECTPVTKEMNRVFLLPKLCPPYSFLHLSTSRALAFTSTTGAVRNSCDCERQDESKPHDRAKERQSQAQGQGTPERSGDGPRLGRKMQNLPRTMDLAKPRCSSGRPKPFQTIGKADRQTGR